MFGIQTSFIIDKIYDILTAFFVKLNHVDPIETGKIRDNFFVVRTATANFYVYKSGEDIICFDSGFGKSQILRELNKLGIDPKCITHVFLTHSDFDHAGGISLFENAKIYLSFDEEQMITGKKARKLGFMYNSKIIRPYHLLGNNDVITVGSTKIRAIAAPGHTPGSMCYFINEAILIVGDALRIINGKVYPIKYYNMDTEQQKESIKKLAQLDNVQLACTGHRGYTESFKEAVMNWK